MSTEITLEELEQMGYSELIEYCEQQFKEIIATIDEMNRSMKETIQTIRESQVNQ